MKYSLVRDCLADYMCTTLLLFLKLHIICLRMSKVILAVQVQRVGVLMSLAFLIMHYTLYFAENHNARLSDSCLVGLGKVWKIIIIVKNADLHI